MMKNLQNLQVPTQSKFWLLSVVVFLFLAGGCHKIPQHATPKIITVAGNLQGPMGIEMDWRGNIWVAETGTANNDGKVVLIKPGTPGMGKGTAHVYDAIINLSSIKNAASQEVEGPAHLMFDNGKLYILAGDMLYTADVSSYKPGDPSIHASTLPSENIGDYVRSLNIVTPNDSHPYNLIKGPDGAIYILDAGANAIIKRSGPGNYSVFAKFPDMKNPIAGPGMPPIIQSVPTGIIYTHGNFLVTTLTGFPFLDGQAVIYKVSLSGTVSLYQSGLTTLVDIADGNYYGHVILHYGSFGPTGFVPNTGSLMFTDGNSTKAITDKLNMPAGLKQISDQSWYVTSLGDGTLLKVTYDY